MKKSNIVTGTPLKDTTPAGIEKYLLDRVRTELGEFHDLALVKPVLRIDTEDGDLSGNIQNGYGTVMLSVGSKALHLPFIIHEKKLLPFDVIRMGGQEVVYDISKLRRLVVGIDKLEKEQSSEGVGTDLMEVVDAKDISTHNGFLGTIMNVRDSHKNRDVNGNIPHRGLGFGDIDEARLHKHASEQFDIAEYFEDFHDKLANVRYFTYDDVTSVISGIEKEASDSASLSVKNLSESRIETKDGIKVQRELAKVEGRKLVSHKRVASGNNVTFPVFDNSQFEYRQGRVYQKLKASVNKRMFGLHSSTNTSKTKSIVVDTKEQYALLGDSDKFMVNVENPKSFNFPTEHAIGLKAGKMYAFEWDKETLSLPFITQRSYLDEEENNGILISVPERAGMHELLKASQSTLFRNSYECDENGELFTVIVIRGQSPKESVRKIEYSELQEFITTNAKNGVDLRISRMIAGRFLKKRSDIYLVDEQLPFFRLNKNITGHFTKPDGMFKEGPLFKKEAAYKQANKARLYIDQQKNPTTYSVEWTFADEKPVGEETGYNVEKKRMDNLSPSQAKHVLENLGYDHRRQALFFEISKRNGRYAEFSLPNAELAKDVSPDDKGVSKAKKAIRNIANSTLNAGNFMPVFENVMADAAAEYITLVSPDSTEVAQGLQSKFAHSESVAVEFEKLASDVRGSAWSEVAYILNLKHHMDKLAFDISSGFVKGAEPVYEELEKLQPTIEKVSSSLLEFNREQVLRVNSPIVSPGLVKRALFEMDELYNYTKIHSELEKNAFFHKGTRKKIDDLNKSLSGLQKEHSRKINDLKDHVVDMRVLSRKNDADPKVIKNKAEQINKAQNELSESVKSIGVNAKEQEKANNELKKMNRMVMTGLGVPGLATLSYGYESTKNN